jgi:hypothetical protein
MIDWPGASPFLRAPNWGKFMKTIFRAGAVGLCCTSVAIAAYAAETITYTYDSRGRLVKVERKGNVNNNVKAEYKYDKAANRTNVKVTSPNPPP